MEFKCNFCGKPYTNRNEYTECVMRCNELQNAREDLEKRQKAAAEADQKRKEKEARNAELKAQMQKHFDGLLDCAVKMYEDEDCCNRAVVYELKLPPEFGGLYDILKEFGLR